MVFVEQSVDTASPDINATSFQFLRTQDGAKLLTQFLPSMNVDNDPSITPKMAADSVLTVRRDQFY
jgi:hypothetical protein